jgi:hypothetical protein
MILDWHRHYSAPHHFAIPNVSSFSLRFLRYLLFRLSWRPRAAEGPPAFFCSLFPASCRSSFHRKGTKSTENCGSARKFRKFFETQDTFT